jgi:hypothetical protein
LLLFQGKEYECFLIIRKKNEKKEKSGKNSFKKVAKILDKELQPCYNMAALEKCGGEHIFPAHTTKKFLWRN